MDAHGSSPEEVTPSVSGCEHCDAPTLPGKRFCSSACMVCDGVDFDGSDGSTCALECFTVMTVGE